MADWRRWRIVGGVLALLAITTTVGQLLKLYPDSGLNPRRCGVSISACGPGG